MVTLGDFQVPDHGIRMPGNSADIIVRKESLHSVHIQARQVINCPPIPLSLKSDSTDTR